MRWKKLNDIRVAYLGKKGELTSVLKSMKDVAPEDRPKVGQMVNEAREQIEAKIEETRAMLARKAREEQMKKEVIAQQILTTSVPLQPDRAFCLVGVDRLCQRILIHSPGTERRFSCKYQLQTNFSVFRFLYTVDKVFASRQVYI